MLDHVLTPRKVAFVLNILGLSYEPRYLEFDAVKDPEHTRYNPNGRFPTLIDHHNDDFVIWSVRSLQVCVSVKTHCFANSQGIWRCYSLPCRHLRQGAQNLRRVVTGEGNPEPMALLPSFRPRVSVPLF